MANSPGNGLVLASPANQQEGARPPPTAPRRVGPVHTLIALRAHRKWLERGCPENTALQDWLEAEAEVKAEIRRGRKY